MSPRFIFCKFSIIDSFKPLAFNNWNFSIFSIINCYALISILQVVFIDIVPTAAATTAAPSGAGVIFFIILAYFASMSSPSSSFSSTPPFCPEGDLSELKLPDLLQKLNLTWCGSIYGRFLPHLKPFFTPNEHDRTPLVRPQPQN